jgi:hypothetical protein
MTHQHTHTYAKKQVDSKKTPMTLEMAQEFARNIVDVLEKGAVPPITEVHKTRIINGMGLPPKMPPHMAQQIKPFDVQACNAHAKEALGKGFIKVERIATCMSSIMATCMVEKQHLPLICQGMVNWAKPIIEAQAFKSAVCVAWRKQLEAQHAVAPQMMQPGGGPGIVVSAKQLKELLMKQGSRLSEDMHETDEDEDEDHESVQEMAAPFPFTEEEVGKMAHVGVPFRPATATGTNSNKDDDGEEEQMLDITHLVRRMESSSTDDHPPNTGSTTTASPFSSTMSLDAMAATSLRRVANMM